MSTLTLYTSPDEIRAVLGVSATEVTDLVLEQQAYSTLLLLDLEDVHVDIPSQYTLISALSEVGRTSQQHRFYLLARLFASYTLAKTLLSSLPYFAVRTLTDGRASFDRQDNVYEDVKQSINGMYTTIRAKLATAYLAIVPAASVVTYAQADFILAATLGSDPVTTTTV